MKKLTKIKQDGIGRDYEAEGYLTDDGHFIYKRWIKVPRNGYSAWNGHRNEMNWNIEGKEGVGNFSTRKEALDFLK